MQYEEYNKILIEQLNAQKKLCSDKEKTMQRFEKKLGRIRSAITTEVNKVSIQVIVSLQLPCGGCMYQTLRRHEGVSATRPYVAMRGSRLQTFCRHEGVSAADLLSP